MYSVLLVALSFLVAATTGTTCPPQPPCPGHCAIGRDIDGCIMCECGHGPVAHGDFIDPHPCARLGHCPLKCILEKDDYDCSTCTCPSGVKQNETECSSDQKCSESNSICSPPGYCTCKSTHARVRNGCVKRPQLGDSCLINGTYLYCFGHGVNIHCDRNAKDPKCACIQGFEAASDKISCKQKSKKLDESCDTDSDCGIAYSSCTNGKCACIDGFQKNGSACKSKSYNCPTGKSDAINGSVKFCELQYNTSSYRHDIDTCPKGYFCHAIRGVVTEEGNPYGFCCPKAKSGEKPKSVCPVGNIHPTGKCPDDSQPEDAPLLPQFEPFCPMTSHECIGLKCCPMPCRRNISGFFAVKDRCYDHVILDDECEVNAQCNHQAECKTSKDKNTKTCQCKPSYVTRDRVFCAPSKDGGTTGKKDSKEHGDKKDDKDHGDKKDSKEHGDKKESKDHGDKESKEHAHGHEEHGD